MNILKEIRREENLKQTEISKILDVSISHYTKLETGLVNPSFQLLKRIKKAFDWVDMNEFFK